MTKRWLWSGLFLMLVIGFALYNLPATLGFDDESLTEDSYRLPDCSICHSPDTSSTPLQVELKVPSDIEVGDTFGLEVVVDTSDIVSDEGNLGLFIIDATTHQLPGEHGWEVVDDPNHNPTPYNYNRVDGVSGTASFTWKIQETSGELGPRSLKVWIKYDNDDHARYVQAGALINVRTNLLADIEVASDGFFHVYEEIDLVAFSAMQDIDRYTWDFDEDVDTGANGNFIDDIEAIGLDTKHAYRDDRTVTVTLTVSNATTTVIGQRTLTIRDYSLFIDGPLMGQCLICHDNAFVNKELNQYGQDFFAQPNHRIDPAGAVADIADLDSDSDEFSNEVELGAGTYPGKSDSFPTDVSWEQPLESVFVISQIIVFEASLNGTEEYPFIWAFGDGTNQTGRTVTHAYDQPGLYTVTLVYNQTRLTRQLKVIDPSDMFPAPLNVCQVCHVNIDGSGGFNVYGQDYLEVYGPMDPWGAQEAIGYLDSDGDGVSNAVEIDAGHFPGDAGSVPLPDLTVKRIWVAPDIPRAEDQVTLYVQIINQGYFHAYNTSVEIRLDGNLSVNLTNVTFFSGIPMIVAHTWEAAGEYQHTVVVEVDTRDLVHEKDEENNRAEFSFGVDQKPGKEGVPGLDGVLVISTLGLLALARRFRP